MYVQQAIRQMLCHDSEPLYRQIEVEDFNLKPNRNKKLLRMTMTKGRLNRSQQSNRIEMNTDHNINIKKVSL